MFESSNLNILAVATSNFEVAAVTSFTYGAGMKSFARRRNVPQPCMHICFRDPQQYLSFEHESDIRHTA
jgi:hypothetical protein